LLTKDFTKINGSVLDCISYDLKAAKLVTARSLKTKLDSTTAITFDGSTD